VVGLVVIRQALGPFAALRQPARPGRSARAHQRCARVAAEGRPGACLTNVRLLRPSSSGIFGRSFHLHSVDYARERIAQTCSLEAALATAPISQTGSSPYLGGSGGGVDGGVLVSSPPDSSMIRFSSSSCSCSCFLRSSSDSLPSVTRYWRRCR